jgi:hypothetical protein
MKCINEFRSTNKFCVTSQFTFDAVAQQNAFEFFGLAGLEFWETGGGCTAFGRSIDNSNGAYVLITVSDDARHPEDDETDLTVGFYDEGENFDGVYVEVTSWRDAIDAANRLVTDNSSPA